METRAMPTEENTPPPQSRILTSRGVLASTLDRAAARQS
jgi:hypothetical protein